MATPQPSKAVSASATAEDCRYYNFLLLCVLCG
jgi:hypothetical protein